MTEVIITQILVMDQVLLPILIGAAGGGIRIILDVIKRKQIGYKTTPQAFLIFLFIYLIIGALSGLLLNSSKIMSLLGGYMAGDLMQIYQKSFMKRKVK